MATTRNDRKTIEEFIIPRGTGKAFHLGAGQNPADHRTVLQASMGKQSPAACHSSINVADDLFKGAVLPRGPSSSCLNSEYARQQDLCRTSSRKSSALKRIGLELFSKPPWERSTSCMPVRFIDDEGRRPPLQRRSCSPRILGTDARIHRVPQAEIKILCGRNLLPPSRHHHRLRPEGSLHVPGLRTAGLATRRPGTFEESTSDREEDSGRC